jgi:hypothetical protein
MPVSEILHAAGVDFAGHLAPEIQFVQVFSAAVVVGSDAIERCQAAHRIFCLSARFRDNQEKWNGAARDLRLVEFAWWTTPNSNILPPPVPWVFFWAMPAALQFLGNVVWLARNKTLGVQLRSCCLYQ